MKCVKSKGEGLTPRSRVPGQHIRTDRTYKRHFIGILSPAPLERNPENTPARSPRRRLPQHATAACESGAQQGVARLSAGWTCRSGWVTVESQGFPRARASGRPV